MNRDEKPKSPSTAPQDRSVKPAPFDLIALVAWLDAEIAKADERHREAYRQNNVVGFGIWDDEDYRRMQLEHAVALAVADAKQACLRLVRAQIMAESKAYLDAMTRYRPSGESAKAQPDA